VQQQDAEPQVGPQQHACFSFRLAEGADDAETLTHGPPSTINTIPAATANAGRIGIRSMCSAWVKNMMLRSENAGSP
jgi:hypothetical protein